MQQVGLDQGLGQLPLKRHQEAHLVARVDPRIYDLGAVAKTRQRPSRLPEPGLGLGQFGDTVSDGITPGGRGEGVYHLGALGEDRFGNLLGILRAKARTRSSIRPALLSWVMETLRRQ